MDGPLYQAIKAQPRETMNSDDRVPNDQIKQLLVFMGTITVISLILVIILIIILILFVWYSQKMRMNRCRCTKSKSSSKEPVMQLRNMNNLSNNIKSNINVEEPVKMVMVHPETHQNPRSNKNITVNPWSAVKVNRIAAVNNSSQSVINQSFTMEDYTAQAHLDTGDNCDNEPFYQEITHLHSDENIGEFESEVNNYKVNQFHKEDDSDNMKSKKNEIIYWQITAKEVARFKPCTETFIERDYTL